MPVASALSSMSSFLLQSLISEGRTFRVTTGLSLLMAPARHRYVRLQGKEERRGGGGGRTYRCLYMLSDTCTCVLCWENNEQVIYVNHNNLMYTTIYRWISGIFVLAYHLADANLVSFPWLLESIFVSTVTSWFPPYEAAKQIIVWFMCSCSNNIKHNFTQKNIHLCNCCYIQLCMVCTSRGLMSYTISYTR